MVVKVSDRIGAQVEALQVGQVAEGVRVHVAKVVRGEKQRFEMSVLVECERFDLTQTQTLLDGYLVEGFLFDERGQRVGAECVDFVAAYRFEAMQQLAYANM